MQLLSPNSTQYINQFTGKDKKIFNYYFKTITNAFTDESEKETLVIYLTPQCNHITMEARFRHWKKNKTR